MIDGGRIRLTDTDKLSLRYLGKDVGLNDQTIREIIEWQQNRLAYTGYEIMVLLVVATNSSMKELTPIHITKEEFIENEIRELIAHFKGYKYDYWNNLSLCIINYAYFAKCHTWPTRLQNIDVIKIGLKATDEKTVRISEGLEAALQIARMHEGQTYFVLISDGQDDDQERTKKIIEVIKYKRKIEFYTYLCGFVAFA